MQQLSRKLRRAIEKAKCKTGRAKQMHKDARGLLCENGYGVFSRFIDMEESDYDTMERFLWLRLSLVKDGSKNNDDWACVVTGLLEGYNLARAVADDAQREGFIREMKRGAKLYDGMRYHFQETGEVLQANLEALRDVLRLASDLKRCGSFNRQDLLDVIIDIEKNFKDRVCELFDGVPRSGIIELEPYMNTGAKNAN